jgi:hypothetical protein
MTAYVNRIGGTAGGLLSNKGRTATYTKLIDIVAQNAALSAAAGSAITLTTNDTLAIATVPVGSYVSNVAVKVVSKSTAASGTVSTGVTGAGTQFLTTTGTGSGATDGTVTMAAYTTKYACTAATPIDILLTFGTAAPTALKLLVSWTLEDTAIVDPVTQV